MAYSVNARNWITSDHDIYCLVCVMFYFVILLYLYIKSKVKNKKNEKQKRKMNEIDDKKCTWCQFCSSPDFQSEHASVICHFLNEWITHKLDGNSYSPIVMNSRFKQNRNSMKMKGNKVNEEKKIWKTIKHKIN